MNDVHYSQDPHPTELEEEFDFCVVGSGASGAVVANTLVAAGRRVLLLERGPFLPEQATELEHGLAAADLAFVPGVAGLELRGRPWTTCNVGGGTVFYAGVSFRARRADFAATPYFSTSDLPIDWPFDYETLAPYYDAIEQRQGVTSSDGDPLHPDARCPTHCLSPFPKTSQAERLFVAAERRGLRPFETPLALLTRAMNDREACVRSTPCDEFRCPVGAKGDAYTVFLRPMLHDKQLRLFAGFAVTRLLRSTKAERVDGVEGVSLATRRRYRFRAKNFVLAGNAIQSAAVLLRSGDRWEPSGIGNRYDMVGRGLCMKLSRYCLGVPRDFKNLVPYHGPFSTFAISDYYVDPACPEGMGGMIYENHIAEFERRGEMLLEVLLADCPRRRNRVRLSTATCELGMPRVVIDYETSSSDERRLNWLTDRAAELLRDAGQPDIQFIESDYAAGSGHLHGTCRAGSDIRTSVVDVNGRVHGMENLFVADGGFIPFPTGVNPTLTIQANALRIAHQMLGRPTIRPDLVVSGVA
jgi:choline dehydrogenase-like flavoprotein